MSVITVGSIDIVLGRARLDDVIMYYNQASDYIDIRGHSDQYISLGILDSGTEMRRIGFGWNSNDGIGVKPLRTIGIIIPYIARTRQRSFGIFDSVRGKSGFSYRSA